jgi:hypothetical protein
MDTETLALVLAKMTKEPQTYSEIGRELPDVPFRGRKLYQALKELQEAGLIELQGRKWKLTNKTTMATSNGTKDLLIGIGAMLMGFLGVALYIGAMALGFAIFLKALWFFMSII